MNFCSWLKSLGKKPDAVVVPIKPVTAPPVEPYPIPDISAPNSVRKLSWNQPTWDKYLIDILSNHFYDSLVKATDWLRIYPGFYDLTRDKQVYVMAELIVAMAYYESSWNPRLAEVDVGNKDDKDSWSIGLLQLSVCDQKNMGVDLGYSYDDLLLAPPNLNLGLAILTRQVKRTGKIILDNKHPDRYWACILDNNKYQSINDIIARVRKYT